MAFGQRQSDQNAGGRDAGDRADSGHQPPAETLRYPTRGGVVEISIWENVQNGDQGERVTYAVTVQRSYKDGENWKKSKSLFPGDLLAAAVGLQQAYIAICNQQAKK